MMSTLFALPALYLVFTGAERQRVEPSSRRRPQPVGEEVEVH
jgi:hypothetical protein